MLLSSGRLSHGILPLLLISPMTVAAPQTMVREYTYNASETDSKVSARKAALQQLQTLLIEEIGVQVQSSFSNTETLDKEAFSRTVQANYQTFASALTRTRIIEERWDGENFYIKAEIEVDPDGLGSQIATTINSQGKNPCDAVRDQVSALLNQAGSPERNKALIELASKAPLDNHCHDWQYNVLYSLTRSRYPVDHYRSAMFAKLPDTEPHNLALYLSPLVNFAMRRDNGLQATEWQTVLSTLPRLPADKVPGLLSTLSGNTDTDPGEISGKQQPSTQLQQQTDDLFRLSKDEQLASPALSTATLATQSIRAYSQRQPAFSTRLLNRYAGIADDPGSLLKPAAEYLEKQLKTGTVDPDVSSALQALLQRLAQQPSLLSDSQSSQLYYFLVRLDRGQEKNPAFGDALYRLLAEQPAFFAQVIQTQNVSEREKNLWLIRYKLPATDLCQPRQCAEALFREEDAIKAVTYADYLVAYDRAATAAEDLIIRKLERVQIMTSGSNRTQLKHKLLTVLGNIGSQDATAQELIIRSLGDLDHQVPDVAADVLIRAGSGSQRMLMKMLPTQEPLVQRRIVKVLGKLPPHPDIRSFLQQLPATDQHMKFAIEDALMAQQRHI